MKKFIALMMALAMIFAMASCNKKENNSSEAPEKPQAQDYSALPEGMTKVETDTDTMKKQAVEALNSINSADLHNDGFTVASTADMIYVPENGDSNYHSALVLRNRMFEQKYSTTLIQFTDTQDNMLETAYYNMLSGIYYTDLFSIPENQLAKFIAKGVLLKTSSIPGADFTKSWYDRTMMSETVSGYNDYAIYGDFNRDISKYYCIYVNRDLLSAAGLEMPYDKVKNGSWTWDELVAMIRSCAAVSEAAGMASSDIALMTKAVYKSSGKSFLYKGYGAEPTVAFGGEGSDKILSALRSIGGYKTLYNENAESSSAATDFMQGKALFYMGTVGEMQRITTMPYDFCILPMPKTELDQDTYYSYVSGNYPVITVYAGTRCTDIADALDGLNAASSGGYLTQAYYRELIDTSIRDSMALDMLDYICGVKGGRAANDFTDVYPEYLPYTVNAFAKGVYNYELTPQGIADSVRGNIGDLLKK